MLNFSDLSIFSRPWRLTWPSCLSWHRRPSQTHINWSSSPRWVCCSGGEEVMHCYPCYWTYRWIYPPCLPWIYYYYSFLWLNTILKHITFPSLRPCNAAGVLCVTLWAPGCGSRTGYHTHHRHTTLPGAVSLCHRQHWGVQLPQAADHHTHAHHQAGQRQEVCVSFTTCYCPFSHPNASYFLVFLDFH